MYNHQRGVPMFVRACAQRSAMILHQRNFLLYQVHAVLAGLNEDGKGA